ncbi:hypothetical protein [Phytopseudomonas dryadis]|uniref:hypothetical protein n=1 Tax=Phytopseudomonas dryadis TaxID=2487520 RepID=UPI0010383F7E|nr:hypothetical protein [Pseudomonas dryadis]
MSNIYKYAVGLRRFFFGIILIVAASGFWAFLIAGALKYFFELDEDFAILYVGGGLFFCFLIYGFLNFRKLMNGGCSS